MSRRIQIGEDTQAARPEKKPAPDASGQAPAGRAPAARPKVERVLEIPVSRIFPDPHQPRTPLLPAGEEAGFIRERFIAREIDCFQAAREWLEFAEADPAHLRRILFLLDMASGFAAEEGGQVNPLTVVPMIEPKGDFLIETGEQRFWAAVIGYVKSQAKGDPPPVKAVVREQLSRKRQVLENRHVGPPSAVSQAREIATLFLSEGYLQPPEALLDASPAEQDPFAIHRWVAGERKPHGSWAALEGIMSMSSRRMQQLLSLLSFPSEILFLADRYYLPERTLREILSEPEHLWGQLVELAAFEGWTGEDFKAAEIEDEVPEEKPARQARPKPDPRQAAVASFKKLLRLAEAAGAHPAALIGELADQAALSDDPEQAYRFLASLAEQVRLRLEGR
jgi:hypothetical protein